MNNRAFNRFWLKTALLDYQEKAMKSLIMFYLIALIAAAILLLTVVNLIPRPTVSLLHLLGGMEEAAKYEVEAEAFLSIEGNSIEDR